ncbi:aspartyl/asparaginyl beta-hydroxylase domain-containing protein [Prosthecobacter sp.]|uniref:aspartyl/asparaginyl beta-hydroxylase domain-containing protein n=1 Tax=Prosthecobacter sp. TaxID=1965333 RepID=UPI003783BE5B
MKSLSAPSARFSLKDWFFPSKPQSCLQVEWAGVLRSGDDMLVPEPDDELRFQVANRMYLLEEGKNLVFDENWNADAWHDTTGYRVVFHAGTKQAQPWPWQKLNTFFTKLSLW